MNSVKWEKDWISKNTKYYDSKLHAESVKRNIEKRYEIIKLKKELNNTN